MQGLGTAQSLAPPRPVGGRKRDALEIIVRAAVVNVFAHVRKMGSEQARLFIANKHRRYDDELTKIICRGVTSPAMTFEEGWAAEFVVAAGADLISELAPRSAFAQLASQGMHLTFGVGDILVPDFIPDSVGMFIRQGGPIPVIQGQATGQILTRKKLASIVTYTGEMSDMAIVSLEGIFKTRIQESTALALDSVLLDDQPATDTRPAGLLNGAAQVTSSGGMQMDLQLLAERLWELAGHAVRAPVLIMNIAQAFAARLQNYRDIIPIIPASVEPGTVLMLDAGDFACAGGQVPRLEVGTKAALHFEDTAPEHLFPGATPVRSLWQEDLLGLRMILEVDWCLRRPGVASYMKGVHWRLGGV